MSGGRFTPVDAARLALATPDRDLTASQRRVVACGAQLWCRQLQFPTVRQIAAQLGRRSPSTVLFGFEGVLGVHAVVIAAEWRQLVQIWRRPVVTDRVDGLVTHAERLAATDQTSLRLPALVASAIAAVDPLQVPQSWHLAASLHLLAAVADRPHRRLDRGVLRGVVMAGLGSVDEAGQIAMPA